MINKQTKLWRRITKNKDKPVEKNNKFLASSSNLWIGMGDSTTAKLGQADCGGVDGDDGGGDGDSDGHVSGGDGGD